MRKAAVHPAKRRKRFTVIAAGQLPLLVAVIAVIIALMKRHQREAAGNAGNNGRLVCEEWRGERELISRTGLLTATHP